MAIGFIGLGNLGRAITTRLVSLGEELVIFNRDKKKIEDLPYTKANTPKELISKCEVIFLCLFDSDAVSNILKGENGLLCEELIGKTIIDLTTNHYERVLEFRQKFATPFRNCFFRCLFIWHRFFFNDHLL